MKSFKSILVVVPHPDDEALLAAGLILRAVGEGSRVAVAVATNGDYLCPNRSKGEARLAETASAMNALGVGCESLYFLGYPDTGYEPEISFLSALRNATDHNKVFASLCSAKTYGLPGVRHDYAFLRTGQHSGYTRACFEEDLQALIDETAPELIVTTSQWDKHGDHSALSYFVRRAACRRLSKIVLWEGIVHSPAGDSSWPTPNSPKKPFTMPQGLEQDTTLKWAERISIPLPSGFDKEEIIKLYYTAMDKNEPEVAEYLLAFAKSDEIFWHETSHLSEPLAIEKW